MLDTIFYQRSLSLSIPIISFFIVSNGNKKLAVDMEEHTKKEEYKKSLSIGITKLDTLNPLLTNNSDVQYILKLVYKPLLDISKDFELKPVLAKEYSRLNEKTYIIKLDENAFWHDGTKFSAEDVVFTIEAIKNKWQSSVYYENVKNIESIKVLDEYTIKIFLKEEMPFFEYKLVLPILPKHQYNENYELIGELTVGTGEYKFKSISDSIIVLLNGNAKTKEIEIVLYDRNAKMYSDFMKQKLDIIITNNINYEEYIGTTWYKTVNIEGRNFNYLLINQSNNFLKDVALRKALNYVINKEEIIQKVYNRKYKKQEFPKGRFNQESFDMVKATRILEETGYSYKNNSWNKDGKILAFNLIVKNQNEKMQEVSEIIKSNLEDFGIRLNVVKLSDSNYEYSMKNNYYDLILGETTLCLEPSFTEFFKSEKKAVNEIMQDIPKIEKEEIKTKKLEELEKICKEEMPFIGLYVDTISLLLNKELKGDFEANWYNVFYNINTWQVPIK